MEPPADEKEGLLGPPTQRLDSGHIQWNGWCWPTKKREGYPSLLISLDIESSQRANFSCDILQGDVCHIEFARCHLRVERAHNQDQAGEAVDQGQSLVQGAAEVENYPAQW